MAPRNNHEIERLHDRMEDLKKETVRLDDELERLDSDQKRHQADKERAAPTQGQLFRSADPERSVDTAQTEFAKIGSEEENLRE